MLTQKNQQIIVNYYNHIRELIVQLECITFESSVEQEYDKLINQLIALHNKLCITTLMANRSLLAITGLQGTGKTTIIKKLYNLPDEILPENSRRGERLPVFITERDVTEIETYVYRKKKLGNGVIVAPEKVTAEDFKNISMNPTVNEDLWLECIVPNRYLKDEQKSLVLLPGFEKDDKDISQLLLEHILYLSSSSIVALRKDTFPRESTDGMLRKIKSIYKDVKPIIAITFGDVNPEQNSMFKEKLIEVFNLPNEEGNRVVVTGAKPQYTEDWETALIDAINQYCYTTESNDRLENELIISLTKQMDASLLTVRKLIDTEIQKRQSETNSEADYNSVLINFQLETDKYIEEIERSIEASLSSRIQPALNELRKYLGTHITWPKQLKNRFLGEKPSELYQLEKKIINIWDDPMLKKEAQNGQSEKLLPPPTIMILDGVTSIVNQRAGKVLEEIQKPIKEKEAPIKITSEEENRMAAFMTELNGTQSSSLIVKKHKEPTHPIERINVFFEKKEDVLPIKLNQSDCKALAVMGTLLIRETYLCETNKDGEFNLDSSLLENPHLGNPIKEIQKLSNTVPTVLKSIPIILGVDGLIDGEVDLVANAATALSGIGIKLSAAQLAGVVGFGFAAAYSTKAIQESIRKANERQLQLSQAGERIFNELPKIQAKAFSSALRQVYNQVSDRIVDKHLEYSGKLDHIGELEHVKYTIRKINLITKELKAQQYADTLFI